LLDVKDYKALKIETLYSRDETEPWEFYETVIPNSKTLYIKLGYFSSFAISILAEPLTIFLINGGNLKMITNHILLDKDLDNLLDYDYSVEHLEKLDKIFYQEPKKFSNILSKGAELFYDCLNYLQIHKRLTIQPVFYGQNEGLCHFKEFVGIDHEHNMVFANGSCNLTPSGLLVNGESFTVLKSWESDSNRETIEKAKWGIIRVLNNEHPNYKYASPDRIRSLIKDKARTEDEIEILQYGKELALIKNNLFNSDKREKYKNRYMKNINSYLSEPRPPEWFQPRDYQKMAYEKWLDNGKKGIFAMATGTGKTLTAINILYEEYKSNKTCKAIILVPTKTLAYQWKEEVEKFNFVKTLMTVDNNGWHKEYSFILRNQRIINNIIIITTYATFNSNRFQIGLRELEENNQIILIADEMHNLGSNQSLQNLPLKIEQRIGLSATPKRVYDEEGSYELEKYFESFYPKYTYRYSMKRAIDEEKLNSYDYYPILVRLTNEEMDQYNRITSILMSHFDDKTNTFTEKGKRKLLERKRILHKAKNKLVLLGSILDDLEAIKGGRIKYTFVYVPEGKEAHYDIEEEYNPSDEDTRLINLYSSFLRERDYNLYKFVGGLKNREEVLRNFENGYLDILLAMKCLDEGVNIPRTEIGIFCSSTGNPRQFVQRRGRLLRTHDEKPGNSIIYDMVVIPEGDRLSNLEKSLYTTEIRRVANFASLADNLEEIDDCEAFKLAEYNDIDIYKYMNEILEEE